MCDIKILSLSELAQLALGTQKMKAINMQALQSLIYFIICKVNCQEEKIHVQGYFADALTELLKKRTEFELLPFENIHVDTYWLMFRRIDEVQKCINKSEVILRSHFADISKRNAVEFNIYDFEHWEIYAGPVEYLFQLYDERKYKLIVNSDFLHKIRRQLSLPLRNRIIRLVEKLQALFQNFQGFEMHINKTTRQLAVIGHCIKEIEIAKKKVEGHNRKFKEALKEVIDIIEIKLDKRHLPVMKKYYTERLERIEEATKNIRVKDCEELDIFPKEHSDICLSCLNWLPGLRRYKFKQKARVFEPMENKVSDCICSNQLKRSSELKFHPHQISTTTDMPIGESNTYDELIDSNCDKSIKHFCKGDFAMKRCHNIIKLHKFNHKLSQKAQKQCNSIFFKGKHQQQNSMEISSETLTCPYDKKTHSIQNATTTPICQITKVPGTCKRKLEVCNKMCNRKYFRSVLCLKTQRCDSSHPRDDFVLPEYLRDYRTNNRKTCKTGFAVKNCAQMCIDAKSCVHSRF